MRLFARRAPLPRRPRPSSPVDPVPDEERPTGCGWFDSSHELQTGLRVTEHAQTETVAQLVPLSWWLAWELAAASAPSSPSSMPCAQVDAQPR